MAKRRYILFVGLIVIIVGLGAFFVWQKYYMNPEYLQKLEFQKRYIEAMRQDTYGGKTEQETLDLFRDALRSGDIELASKYFKIEDDLSRGNWLKVFGIFKEQSLLGKIADDISSDTTILEFNEYTGVWKIVNFKGDE